jgi:hypothetical protein
MRALAPLPRTRIRSWTTSYVRQSQVTMGLGGGKVHPDEDAGGIGGGPAAGGASASTGGHGDEGPGDGPGEAWAVRQHGLVASASDAARPPFNEGHRRNEGLQDKDGQEEASNRDGTYSRHGVQGKGKGEGSRPSGMNQAKTASTLSLLGSTLGEDSAEVLEKNLKDRRKTRVASMVDTSDIAKEVTWGGVNLHAKEDLEELLKAIENGNTFLAFGVKAHEFAAHRRSTRPIVILARKHCFRVCSLRGKGGYETHTFTWASFHGAHERLPNTQPMPHCDTQLFRKLRAEIPPPPPCPSSPPPPPAPPPPALS